MGEQAQIAQRLSSVQFQRKDVIGALRGEKLPDHLGYPLVRLCTIRGILHSPSFAEGEAAPLGGLQEYPEFTRALNARAIMSNRIPDMQGRPEELPYCIWYPEVASQDTYRELASKYPQMRYQVARACAVAGYTDLYLELQDSLLPEVAVAEEALAAGNDDIFDHIMAQPVRYKIFDDYYRTINLDGPPQVAPHLNGDTCVLSVVERRKQAFTKPVFYNEDDDDDDFFDFVFPNPGFKELMYDITEDQGIAESVPDDDDLPDPSPEELMLHLLTSPLPTHLPAGNKDMLILMAAYHGNIDRYARLRRPKPVKYEIFFIVRGIYHNPLFALWWERHQKKPAPGEPFHMPYWEEIEKAIIARHIMNNDLSLVLAKKDDDKRSLPYLICHPEFAASDTYRELALRVPAMREPCVRAAIYAGNVELFDELMALPDVVPNRYLAAEARHSGNPHFLSAIQSRAEELGISLLASGKDEANKPYEPWKLESVSFVRTKFVNLPRSPYVFGEFQEQGAVYNGTRTTVTPLELFLLVPESWRPKKEVAVELDYKNWPPELVQGTESQET